MVMCGLVRNEGWYLGFLKYCWYIDFIIVCDMFRLMRFIRLNGFRWKLVLFIRMWLMVVKLVMFLFRMCSVLGMNV